MNDILERFYSKLKPHSSGCILWTDYVERNGYGHFFTKQLPNQNPQFVGAHVFAFILHYKREPLGDLHHKCETKRCCNVEHLEEKTRSEHMLEHKRKEFCSAGHELAVVGTNKNGSCRECRRIYQRDYNKKNAHYLYLRQKEKGNR